MSDAVSPLRRALGWGVHAYTALGLPIAAVITALLVEPTRTPDTYRWCFLLMVAAVIVDGTDGTLARAVRIKEAVPEFDGRRLDDLVDFLLYTCLPLLLIDRAGVLPTSDRWAIIVVLVASAYGFCQTDIKTADGAFLGFPSYWNVAAYYLVALGGEGRFATGLLLFFAVLTFVPSRYPYPTQPGRMNRLLLVLSVPWAVLMLIDLLQPWAADRSLWAAWASFAYPALYLLVAWVGSIRRVIGGTQSD